MIRSSEARLCKTVWTTRRWT